MDRARRGHDNFGYLGACTQVFCRVRGTKEEEHSDFFKKSCDLGQGMLKPVWSNTIHLLQVIG